MQMQGLGPQAKWLKIVEPSSIMKEGLPDLALAVVHDKQFQEGVVGARWPAEQRVRLIPPSNKSPHVFAKHSALGERELPLLSQ